MLRMFKELKGSYRYVVLIVLLLFGQAYCDLSLPAYTSDIINVGVQQGGIADGVPERIREESMKQIFWFLDEKDQKEVKGQYQLEDGVYHLQKINKEKRETLNQIFSVPMVALAGFKE